MKVGVPPAHHSEPALTPFRQQWQIYRKVVDYNYLFHREAYNCLHRILVDEAIQPFRFLDVACGDASTTVEALKGTQVASYHGIDLCQAALELASQALETLACPVKLDRRDFVEALRDCLDIIVPKPFHHIFGEEVTFRVFVVGRSFETGTVPGAEGHQPPHRSEGGRPICSAEIGMPGCLGSSGSIPISKRPTVHL